MRPLLAGAGGLIAVAFVLAIAFSGQTELSDAELAERIRATPIEWASYQEDIKAAATARAAAEWSGEIVRVAFRDGVARVVVRLRGRWATRGVALPILLRTPEATECWPDTTERHGDERLYVFRIGDAATPAPPWVAIQLPGGEQRITLDAGAAWRKQD